MQMMDRFKQEVRMSVLQRQCMIIVSVLGTTFLLSIWPRFLEDALSVNWMVYVVLISVAALPLLGMRAKSGDGDA